jgi:predicted DNA-binding transcriptional regulator AlpA
VWLIRITQVEEHQMEIPTMNQDKLISLRGTASRLDLSVRAVYRLIARGLLPRPVKVGGATKFFESDLSSYLDSLKAKRD